MKHTDSQMAYIYANIFTTYAMELHFKNPRMSEKQRYDKYKLWALRTFGNMEEAIYFIKSFINI